jgi:acetoin utilization deacetylase AcuC-like enzyme
MGFCIFNNIAIGVAYTIGRGLAEKVAIVDWDVHHGNGTQNAFYTTNKVLYISLHQYPFYPGTGASYETGEAEGKGFTLNLPMMAGSGDEEYRQAFDDKIIPAIDNFKPDLLMISAGFDAHKNDPLAGIELSTDFYTEMTEIIVEMAKQHCYGRIVSTLEGGYSLNVLADSVKAHLKVLGGD